MRFIEWRMCNWLISGQGIGWMIMGVQRDIHGGAVIPSYNLIVFEICSSLFHNNCGQMAFDEVAMHGEECFVRRE